MKMIIMGALIGGLLLSNTSAQTLEDVERLKQIKSFEMFPVVFTSILLEKEKQADPIRRSGAQHALKEALSVLDSWKNKPNEQSHIFFCQFPTTSWGQYPSFLRAYSLLQGSSLSTNKHFDQCGFYVGKISNEFVQNFLQEFESAKPIPFVTEDHDPNYSYTDTHGATEVALNRTNIYYMLEDRHLATVKPILEFIKDEVAECLGMPWRATSLRIWATPPGDPNKNPTGIWHTDGYPSASLKILMYMSGADYETGTTELQTPKGVQGIVGDPGTWLLFKNSTLVHRAIIPTKKTRLMLEINLSPSIAYELEPVCAGTNARHPFYPWMYTVAEATPRHKKDEYEAIYIGGREGWKCPGWFNLKDRGEIVYHPNCRIPFESESVRHVYSQSLALWNLPTAYRMVSEAHRVLETGGNLVIRIPDYEQVLDAWSRNDLDYFQTWCLDGAVFYWQNKGVISSIDAKAAMIFCSIFNQDYGYPFSSGLANGHTPYFGPPALDSVSLRAILSTGSPLEISQKLRENVLLKENSASYHFFHQSAWSRDELRNLLEGFGFEVISFDSSQIIDGFHFLPGIENMREVHTYCLAKKK